MTIRYHKLKRRLVTSDETSEMRVFPVVTYKYGKAADLDEVAKKIAKQSILGEGEVYNMLKYFCASLQEILLDGRQVNIDGFGYFSLTLQGKGVTDADKFTTNDITGLRICFRAHNDIRIHNGATTRTNGLNFLDVDKINSETTEGTGVTDPDGGGGDDHNESPL